jgi:hypothetical protein
MLSAGIQVFWDLGFRVSSHEHVVSGTPETCHSVQSDAR